MTNRCNSDSHFAFGKNASRSSITPDLSKVCADGSQFEKLLGRVHKKTSKKYPRAWFYEGCCHKCQHENKVVKDQYGDFLRLVPAEEVLKAMISDNENNPYKRFNVAISMLKQVIKGWKGEQVYCILFGY